MIQHLFRKRPPTPKPPDPLVAELSRLNHNLERFLTMAAKDDFAAAIAQLTAAVNNAATKLADLSKGTSAASDAAYADAAAQTAPSDQTLNAAVAAIPSV